MEVLKWSSEAKQKIFLLTLEQMWASSLCSLCDWGMAWQWQCSTHLGLYSLPNHLPLWLTVLGWDVAFWQSSLLSFREKSIDPLPLYSWNQSRNCNCFLPPFLVHTELSKTSLELLWSLTRKDTASLCTAFKVWFNPSQSASALIDSSYSH